MLLKPITMVQLKTQLCSGECDKTEFLASCFDVLNRFLLTKPANQHPEKVKLISQSVLMVMKKPSVKMT